jgi:hypothetical protein
LSGFHHLLVFTPPVLEPNFHLKFKKRKLNFCCFSLFFEILKSTRWKEDRYYTQPPEEFVVVVVQQLREKKKKKKQLLFFLLSFESRARACDERINPSHLALFFFSFKKIFILFIPQLNVMKRVERTTHTNRKGCGQGQPKPKKKKLFLHFISFYFIFCFVFSARAD